MWVEFAALFSSLLQGFFSGFSSFLPLQKSTQVSFHLDFTVDKETLNGCVTSNSYFMYLFIYLCLVHRAPKVPMALLVKLDQMAMT